MTITTGTTNKHTFEVVGKIPKGFFVWNIGDNMGDNNYIPLCEDLNPNDKNSYEINQNTLKAIKLDKEEVMILRDAAGYGVNDLKSAKRAMNRKDPKGYIAKKKKELAEKTISIFERIS